MSESIYLWLIGVTVLVSALVAMYTWRRRKAPGALFLFGMFVTNAIWAGSLLGFHLVQSEAARFFWFDVLHIGAFLGTPPFIFFALQHTGRERWLTRRNMVLLSIAPVIGLLATWTNPLHGVFYKTQDYTSNNFEDWVTIAGGGYQLYLLLYAYPLIFYCLGIIAQSYFRSPALYRRQSGAIFAGVLVPMIGSIAYNAVFANAEQVRLDPTPILAAIEGLFFAYGLFSFRLLDISPVARHTLIESMTDGVIASDAENRIIDINPAAIRHLGLEHPEPIGLPLNKLSFPIPDSGIHEVEFKTADESLRYFNLRIEQLPGRLLSKPGRLILIRDITEKKLAEEALQKANQQLQSQLTEIETLQASLREQAIRDGLTGLFNRRRLDESLVIETERASRHQRPLSILMVEIDFFKSFNDTFGHEAGDLVICKIAELIQASTRVGDAACRYGGDEFALILPETTSEAAYQRAERLREDVTNLALEYSGRSLGKVTVSIGVANYPQHSESADSILRAADKAMYQAKQIGKNRVVVALSV